MRYDNSGYRTCCSFMVVIHEYIIIYKCTPVDGLTKLCTVSACIFLSIKTAYIVYDKEQNVENYIVFIIIMKQYSFY